MYSRTPKSFSVSVTMSRAPHCTKHNKVGKGNTELLTALHSSTISQISQRRVELTLMAQKIIDTRVAIRQRCDVSENRMIKRAFAMIAVVRDIPESTRLAMKSGRGTPSRVYHFS